MKIIQAIALLGFAGAAVGGTAHHDNHNGHAHKHATDCGHAAEWHVDHFDYNHEGHDHHAHAGKVHESGSSLHKKHKHGHGLNCGHDTRISKGLVEYKHEGHWHHQHGSHMHESHG